MAKKKTSNKLGYKFTPVDKAYYQLSDLKLIEILILSRMDEFIENGNQCYITNEEFSSDFNVSRETVKRALNSLEEKGYIKRNTKFHNDNGKASKKRTLERGQTWYNNVLPNRLLNE